MKCRFCRDQKLLLQSGLEPVSDRVPSRDGKMTIFFGPARPVVPFPGPARPVIQFLILGPFGPV